MPQRTFSRQTTRKTSPIYAGRRARYSSSLLEEGEVFTVEDLQSLLERLDLLFAARNAILVAYAGVHTGGLQFLVVLHGRVQLLLRALQVALGFRELGLGISLLCGLVLHLGGLGSLVRGRVVHEFIVS